MDLNNGFGRASPGFGSNPPIGSNPKRGATKCPPMATVSLPKEKKGSRPSKPTIGCSTADSRYENEDEAMLEDSESEEDEEEESTQGGMDKIRELVNEAKVQFEGCTYYKRSNAKLHTDITRVMDRQYLLAQRQDL